MPRTLVLFLLVVGYSITMHGQNLVVNPGFESFTACPLGPSELENAIPWRNPFDNLIGDTCSTSDLYNSCNFLGAFGVGVPANIMGNEAANMGNGYAGIILYEGVSLFGCLNFFGTGWREYVEGTLSQPLVAGQTYCVSFHISLADNVKFATDDIAVYLSSSVVAVNCATVGNSSNLTLTPQLEHSAGDITNTSGWVQLSWDYLATGGEQYITIGNFKNDANTTYTCVNGNAFLPYAYYYIDDVAVVPGSCSQEPCQLQASVPTTQDVSCHGGATGSATAQALNGIPPYVYAWEPGGLLGAAQQGLAAGTYTVTISDQDGCTAQASVDIAEPEVPLVAVIVGTSPATCGAADGTATVSATGGTVPYQFLWSPVGGTQATGTGMGPGGHMVTITDQNNCMVQADTFIDEVPTVASITGPEVFCAGESIILTASGGVSYNWNTGDTTAAITVVAGGSYTVTVTGCGTDEATLTVNEVDVQAAFSALPAEGFAPLLVTFSNGSQPPGTTFSWDLGDGSLSTAIMPTNNYADPGTYSVVLTANYLGCSSMAYGSVLVLEPLTDSDLWVPNVFSPNGDGHNDQWGPVARGLTSLQVDIFNRWGQLVAAIDKPSQTWTGRTSAGEAVPDGTYYYILEAAGVDGRTYALQGVVTLLR